MQNAEVLHTALFGAGSKHVIKTHEEVDGIVVHVFLEFCTVVVFKLKADLAGTLRSRITSCVAVLEVLDEYCACEEVLGGASFTHAGGQAKLFMLLEKYNMEVASTLLELVQEELYSMDGMQKLETVWKEGSANMYWLR